MAQARDTTGLVPDLPTRVTFSILPRPRVKLENFSIRDSRDGFSVSAKVAKGDLRLIALAAGKIELSSLTLFQPTIIVGLDGAPLRSGGAFARASSLAPASPEAVRADSTRLAVVRIVSGEITVHSANKKFEARFDKVDGKLDWRLLGAPASLTATGGWRGRSAVLTAWVGHPAALLRGASSPVKFSADADLLSAKFDGALEAGPAWRLQGRLDAKSPTVPGLMRWIGDGPRLPHAFGAAALAGGLSAGQDGLSFTDLSLSIGGSDFEGDAAFRTTATRPMLSATLASDALTITPYLLDVPRIVDAEGAWSDRAFPTDFGPIDLDLRISAARAKLNRLELSDLGLTVLLEGGRLDLSLPEAKTYGGTLKGRATITRTAEGETWSGSANVSNVEIGALLWDADDCDVLNGLATGQISVDSRGASVADLVRDLTGSAKFNVQHGELVGIDFEQALRRVEKRPLSVALEVRAGRTSFDSFAGGLAFGDDKAELQNVKLSGPGAQVDLSGATLLGERALDVKAIAQQAGSDGVLSAGGSRLAMKIEGYWDDPRLVLDVEGLVRRSEAAAPLFAPTTTAAHE